MQLSDRLLSKIKKHLRIKAKSEMEVSCGGDSCFTKKTLIIFKKFLPTP